MLALAVPLIAIGVWRLAAGGEVVPVPARDVRASRAARAKS